VADAGLLVSLVRRCAPGYFAIVMATGIVSTAFQLAGFRVVSAVLLIVAALGFAGLAAASAVRLAMFPGVVGDDLRDPVRAFTGFAFVAAADALPGGPVDGRVPGRGVRRRQPPPGPAGRDRVRALDRVAGRLAGAGRLGPGQRGADRSPRHREAAVMDAV
jgi:hypothetical protein